MKRKEREKKRERRKERYIFYPLVDSPKGCTVRCGPDQSQEPETLF